VEEIPSRLSSNSFTSAPTGPPERVEAGLIQPTAAVITWDEPPCDQRNGLISRYEYVLEGLDPWAQGDAQKASVAVERVELAKLTPFTRYSFKVRGLNGKGGGPFSEPIEILTKPGGIYLHCQFYIRVQLSTNFNFFQLRLHPTV